jgi:hypothetical protein
MPLREDHLDRDQPVAMVDGTSGLMKADDWIDPCIDGRSGSSSSILRSGIPQQADGATDERIAFAPRVVLQPVGRRAVDRATQKHRDLGKENQVLLGSA